MNRRDTLIALLAAGIAPQFVFAQQPGKVWRIAFVSPTAADSDPAESSGHAAAFMGEMQAAGHTFGVDYVVELLTASRDGARPTSLANDLTRLNIDIVIPVTPIAVSAAVMATKSLPIVCIGTHDPVGSGMAASLARPGGNITGLASFYGELIPKHLELIKAIAPKVTRVAFLVNSAVPHDTNLGKKIADAAERLGLRIQIIAVDSAERLPGAFASMIKDRAGAVITVADSLFYLNRVRIAELAMKHHLPSFFPNRENVQAGGLLSYGEDFVELFAHAAKYVSKIMKGAKAADLPIEQPTKFRLTINRKTARALKLSIPQEMLLRADEMIG